MEPRTIISLKSQTKKHTRSEPASQEYPEGLACQEQSCAPSRELHKKHQHLLQVAPAVIPLAVELQIFDKPFFSEGNKLQESGFHKVLLVTFKLSILMTKRGQYLVN
jgi:hypothetical protein